MYFEVGAASLEECRINTLTIIRFVENSMAHGWFLLILYNPVIYFLSDVLPLL